MCDQCLCGMTQCLPPDARFAYLLREVSGLRYHDVAEMLKVEPDAARQMVSRSQCKLARFMSGHCTLAHPDGPCRCRMHSRVETVDLPAEYAPLRRSVHHVRVIKESEQVLPLKDYRLELSQTGSPGHHSP